MGFKNSLLKLFNIQPDLPPEEADKKRHLLTERSESDLNLVSNPVLNTEWILETLSAYDMVSFDVFDTLIYRPFSSPDDLFYLVGDVLNLPDYHDLRIRAEKEAREDCLKINGHSEIGIGHIQMKLNSYGEQYRDATFTEMDLEEELCYANPFMAAIWRGLKAYDNIETIITTDMYLPKDLIDDILNKNGFLGYKKIYLSSDEKKSKAKGDLLLHAKDENRGSKMFHIGDNPQSDFENSKKYRIDTFLYNNVNTAGKRFRAMYMSPLIGSAYRGIVNSRLYCGLRRYTKAYEYGYIYGGLFNLVYSELGENEKTGYFEGLLGLTKSVLGEDLREYWELFTKEFSEGEFRDIATGMADFKKDYCSHFNNHSKMHKIPERDVIEPMIVAAGHEKRYLLSLANTI